MKFLPARQTGLRLVLLAAAALSFGPWLGAAGTTKPVSTTLSFSIDGVACPVSSWEGGDPRGRASAGKQLTAVDVAPLTLEFSVPLPAPIQNWVGDFLANQATAHTLVSTESNFNQTAATSVVLTNCVLTEVRFSGLDAGAKQSARVALVIQPGNWQRSTAAGPAPVRPVHAATSFRLQIAGLAADMISQIEAFTVRRSPGGGVEFPNLLVTLAAGRAADWLAWRDASLGLVPGGAITAQKKNGSLQFLDNAQSPGPLNLGLEGLQIIRATRLDSAAEGSDQVLVELLCDRITMASGPTPAPATGPATAPATTPAPATAPANETPTEPTKPDDKSDPSAPAPATSSADQGERDPADFPRPKGMERQTFVSSRSATQQRDYATYTAKLGFGEMLARYDDLVAPTGWKMAYRTESGETPATQMIIIEWHREAKGPGGKEPAPKESVAEVRIYHAKTGSTVAVTVTSYQPAMEK